MKNIDFLAILNWIKANKKIGAFTFILLCLYLFGFRWEDFRRLWYYTISSGLNMSMVIMGFFSLYLLVLLALRENSEFIFQRHRQIRAEEKEQEIIKENERKELMAMQKEKIHAYCNLMLEEFDCDRAGVVLYSNSKLSSTGIPYYFATLTFLKEKKTIKSIYEKWQYTNLDNIKDWTDPLLNGDLEIIPDVDELEKTDLKRADVMRSYHHQSLVQIGLGRIHGKEIGYVTLMWVKSKLVNFDESKIISLKNYREKIRDCMLV